LAAYLCALDEAKHHYMSAWQAFRSTADAGARGSDAECALVSAFRAAGKECSYIGSEPARGITWKQAKLTPSFVKNVLAECEEDKKACPEAEWMDKIIIGKVVEGMVYYVYV
jgi:hypothetical protein